jgi:hypothetical protein
MARRNAAGNARIYGGGFVSIRMAMMQARVHLEGACHLWRKIPSRQLSIDLEADERFGRDARER